MLVTYAYVPAGLNVMVLGNMRSASGTDTSPVTAFVARLTTETLFTSSNPSFIT